MAVMLLVGGGLLIHSFVKLANVNPGYDAADVLTFQVALPPDRYPNARMKTFADDLVARLRQVPGVQAAAFARQLPMVDPDRQPVIQPIATLAQRRRQTTRRPSFGPIFAW